LSSVHNRAPGVIRVDASSDMSTNPHPNPHSLSRSMKAMASPKPARLQGCNKPMLPNVRLRGAGSLPQAISAMTIG